MATELSKSLQINVLVKFIFVFNYHARTINVDSGDGSLALWIKAHAVDRLWHSLVETSGNGKKLKKIKDNKPSLFLKGLNSERPLENLIQIHKEAMSLMLSRP